MSATEPPPPPPARPGGRPPALAVLAAGASRRLGTCKALVDLGGRSALERVLAAAAGRVDGAPLVVAGRHEREIRAALAGSAAEVATNERWRAGRTSSVKLAARLRPVSLLVWPIDVPLVAARTVARLVDEWVRAGSPAGGWLAPATLEGGWRPGHPIVVGRALLARLEELADDAPLFDLRARAAPLWTVPVDDPAIHDDLDTPDDLKELRSRASGSP